MVESPWWIQTAHLFGHAWNAMIAATGTSSLGLIVWTVGLAAAGWLVRRFNAWRENRKKLPKRQAIQKAFEGGLRDALIEALAIFLIATIAWAIFIPVVIYRNHNQLASEVWRLENQQKPDLHMEPTYMFEGINNDTHEYFIIMGVEISNPTGPARSLADWNISVSVGGKVKHGHQMFFVKDGLHATIYGKKITLEAAQFCPSNMENNIPTAGSRQCWMVAAFDKSVGEEVKKSPNPPTATLHFIDVLTQRPYDVPQPIVSQDNSHMFR